VFIILYEGSLHGAVAALALARCVYIDCISLYYPDDVTSDSEFLLRIRFLVC